MSRYQLTQLARPFPAKYVKKPAPGKYGTYVDHEIVTQALLFILGPFSFQIEQVFYNPDGILDGCTAALTCTIDGREVTITEAGDCENPTNSKTQGDRLKKAASDALKRCAMRTGCGIHLWAGTEGDFFLFESLSKEDLRAHDENAEGDKTSVQVSVGSGTGTAPPISPSATSPAALGDSAGAGVASTSPPAPDAAPAISKNRLGQLQSKLVEMQGTGFKVDGPRRAAGLPLLTEKCTPAELEHWAALLNQHDKNLNRVPV